MKVFQLGIKPAKSAGMRHPESITLERGHGILGDANARVDSPRQVLVAGQQTYEELGLPTGALRENILLDSDIPQLQSGQLLLVGGAVLRMTFPCEVCRKLKDVRPDLAKAVVGRRGMLARVVTSGQVEVGRALFYAL